MEKTNQIDILSKDLIIRAALGKTCHFNAARRNRSNNVCFGIPVILINVLLGSVLIADLNQLIPDILKWISALFAIIAASLSGTQTYMKYQNKYEEHMKVGNKLIKIEKKAELIYRKYLDNILTKEQFYIDFEIVNREYTEICEDSSNLQHLERDFKKALNYLKSKNNKELVFNDIYDKITTHNRVEFHTSS